MVAKTLELAGFGSWPDEDGGLWLRADGDAVMVGWNAEGLLATTAALHRDSGRDLERMRKALYTAVAATLSGSALAVTELGGELRVTLPCGDAAPVYGCTRYGRGCCSQRLAHVPGLTRTAGRGRRSGPAISGSVLRAPAGGQPHHMVVVPEPPTALRQVIEQIVTAVREGDDARICVLLERFAGEADLSALLMLHAAVVSGSRCPSRSWVSRRP